MEEDKNEKTPTATCGANEWGTPDWLDAVAYSNISDWDFDRWRWEFLRRRDDYRHDYKAACRARIESGFRDPKMDEKFFISEGAELYGLLVYYDPSVSTWNEFGPNWSDPKTMLAEPLDASERWWQIKTLTFDLGKPIAPQLKAAKVLLLEEQGLANLTPEEQWTFAYGAEYTPGRDIPEVDFVKALQYSPRAMKISPQKWALYLRVLDAREAGASLSQIVEILPQSISRSDPKAAHNVYEQARALQFRF
jgi:hypothetical protein